MKPSIKIALGIFTSLATIGFIWLYDFYIKDRIDSEEVVVVKAGEQILRSEQITEEKIVIERRAKESLIEDVVLAKDLKKIIGRDSKQDIVGNSMISTKMVDFDDIVPNTSKGEAIRPITKDMIYAQPGSLRRKDVIDLYLVTNDGKKSNISPNVATNTPSTTGRDKTHANNQSSNVPVLPNAQNIDTKPFLEDVKVVYVKDSGNKEVVSAAEGNNQDKRLNATSTISDIEVILNEEDFAKLMDEVLGKGSKLYITYQ